MLRSAPQTPEEIPLHLKFDSLIAVMWSCSVGQHMMKGCLSSNNLEPDIDDFFHLYAKVGSNWTDHFIEHDQERFLCEILMGTYDSPTPEFSHCL